MTQAPSGACAFAFARVRRGAGRRRSLVKPRCNRFAIFAIQRSGAASAVQSARARWLGAPVRNARRKSGAGSGAAGETAHVRMHDAAPKRDRLRGADHQQQARMARVFRQHAPRRARRHMRQHMRREPRDRQRQPEAEALKALL
jgi:hypothetical protein